MGTSTFTHTESLIQNSTILIKHKKKENERVSREERRKQQVVRLTVIATVRSHTPTDPESFVFEGYSRLTQLKLDENLEEIFSSITIFPT